MTFLILIHPERDREKNPTRETAVVDLVGFVVVIGFVVIVVAMVVVSLWQWKDQRAGRR